MNYTYELKYSSRLKKRYFFVYESENGIKSGVSFIKDIVPQPSSFLNTFDTYDEARRRMYIWLLANHPELLL
jgi:hypothetical protein